MTKSETNDSKRLGGEIVSYQKPSLKWLAEEEHLNRVKEEIGEGSFAVSILANLAVARRVWK